MNRCVICDYTEENGSELTGRAPSHKNTVSLHTNETYSGYKFSEFICDECSDTVDQNFAELSEFDDEVEGS